MQLRIVVLGTVFALVTGCSAGAGETRGPAAATCESNADCVPAGCCHPDSCVAKSRAPDCAKVACTMDCRPGTLDCGNGRCECSGGACTARFSGQ